MTVNQDAPIEGFDRDRYALAANPAVTGSYKRTFNALLILLATRTARPPPEGKPRKRWVLVVPTLLLGGTGFMAAHPEALSQLLAH